MHIMTFNLIILHIIYYTICYTVACIFLIKPCPMDLESVCVNTPLRIFHSLDSSFFDQLHSFRYNFSMQKG